MFANVVPYPKSSQTTKDAATQTSEEGTTTSTISTQTSPSEILHGAFYYASTLPDFYTQSSVIPSNLNITEIPATNPVYHFQLGLSLPTQATKKPKDSPVSSNKSYLPFPTRLVSSNPCYPETKGLSSLPASYKKWHSCYTVDYKDSKLKTPQ